MRDATVTVLPRENSVKIETNILMCCSGNGYHNS